MSLSISRNFPGIFVIFRVFLVPLKQFLLFLELFLALKIISKKKTYPFLPGLSPWARPAPTRARAGPAARPAKAHRPRQAMAAMARSPGRRRPFLGVRAGHGMPRVPLKRHHPAAREP
jgi:hypothetical protein